MRSRLLGFSALAIASAVLLVGCTSSKHSATPTPTPTPVIPVALNLAAHSVAQEGLAIALASNVLQTQLNLVVRTIDESKSCHNLPQGGSTRLTTFAEPKNVVKATVSTYYKRDCTGIYIKQGAHLQSTGADAIKATATAGYWNRAEVKLGTLTTRAQAEIKSTGIELSGTGTFTSATGGTTASLGLACQPDGLHAMNCQGGIAQDFAALGHSLGSITPLKLHAEIGNASKRVTFSGSGRTTSTAALGALSIARTTNNRLMIDGAATESSTAVTTGEAGGLVLFPGTPTGWTITDTPGDVVFTISVSDNTTRTLTASVKQISTGKVLATLALDQSGSGTVTYLGAKPAPVVSWILSK